MESQTTNDQRAAGGMESHWYEVTLRDLGALLGWTAASVLGLGLAAAVALRLPFFPGPAYLSDADTTLLAAKRELAAAGGKVDWIAVGDSSCLMNLNTAVVDAESRGRLRNLGALSFLGLESFGRLAGECIKSGAPPRVLLVVHPDALRMAKTSETHREILDAAFDGRNPPQLRTNNLISEWMGWNAVRARGLDRWVPTVLSGGFGGRYGFTESLREELLRRGGSLDETGIFVAATNRNSAEYRLAPRLERESAAFRKSLPAGAHVQLVVSPVPRSHALRGHEATAREMRKQLGEWLGAEADWGLPLVLEDVDFGTVTHLRPEAARRYSALVAARLASWARE